MNEIHNQFIERCFQLAEKGRGLTKSNPIVGAVLVYNGKIISEGFHAEFGGAHAEVNCIKNIDNQEVLSNSTLYISLEPCNYHGKTPACTNLILNKGIQKVVVGSADFNPKVKNQGIDYLRSQEIDVVNLNLIENQKQLNISFFINQVKNEPYFIGKIAFSNDKYIGREGDVVKITSREIDTLSHKLRSECDAILVGKNTWLNDKPKLDIRHYYSENQPDIIVLSNNSLEIESDFNRKIINIHTVDSPESLKRRLFELGYRKILVEGGAEVFDYFMKHQILHEIYTIQNNILTLNRGIQFTDIQCNKYTLKSTQILFNQTINQYFRNGLFDM